MFCRQNAQNKKKCKALLRQIIKSECQSDSWSSACRFGPFWSFCQLYKDITKFLQRSHKYENAIVAKLVYCSNSLIWAPGNNKW